MNRRFFEINNNRNVVRQASQEEPFEQRVRTYEDRQMRQMKSVNKVLQMSKNSIIFQQGQKMIGHYKFDFSKQIGSGYSSKVYQGKSTKDEKDVAVKVIELKKFKASHFSMLQNQIEILKKIKHPNIVRFQGVYKTPTHLYLITELCRNGDLLAYMTRKGKLPQQEALRIFGQIVQGVKHLFRTGIIHRDLKPGNIFLDGNVWKVGDFGFAIEAQDELKTRNNVGTPLYMSLESLQNNIYSAESDIFALGVLLFELLFGITPWECKTQEELIRKLQKAPVKIPSRAKISQELRDLLKRFCQIQRLKRMNKKQFLDLHISFPLKQELCHAFINNEALSTDKQMNMESGVNYEKSGKSWRKQANFVDLASDLKRSQGSNKVKNTPSLIKMKSESDLLSLLRSTNNREDFDTKLQRKRLLKVKEELTKQWETSQPIDKEKCEKSNRTIVLWLMNFSRFMYYLMKNIHFCDISENSKQKLRIVPFRHAITFVRQLKERKENYLLLNGWAYYKTTSNYQKIDSSLTEYLNKYQKEYLSIIKSIDQSILREMSSKLEEIFAEELDSLGVEFYSKLTQFLASILRENNHNLASELCGSKKELTESIKPKVEGLKQIYEYFKLVKWMSSEGFSYQMVEQAQNVEVIKSYQESSVTLQEFLALRKELKYI